MSDGESDRPAIVELIQARLEEIRAAAGGPADLAPSRIDEELTIEKYDKTDVVRPGVEGLAPIERIRVKNGVLVEHWRAQEEA